jgi:hypothetical protein
MFSQTNVYLYKLASPASLQQVRQKSGCFGTENLFSNQGT